MAGKKSAPFATAEAALRAHALAKPSASEHFPWGERAIKVNGKVFLFMFADATKLSCSTKLPDSSQVALMLPFAEPTGYGLGKAGWVTARFEAGDAPPVDMLCSWIDESYRAVAPAKLAKLAPEAKPTAPKAKAKPAKAKKPAAKAKPAARKPAAKAKPAANKPAVKAKPAAKKPAAKAKKPAQR